MMLLMACGDDDDAQIDPNEASAISAYLDSLGIEAGQDSSGLYSYPIVTNPGSSAAGQVASIYYKLSLIDGTVLDVFDSLDGEPLRVKQGSGSIYPVGLDYALAYMDEGETWGFILPSSIAYSNLSFSTLIPPQAIILAEIRVISTETEDEILNEEIQAINAYVSDNNITGSEVLGSGITYKRISEGSSGEVPQEGSILSITYTGSFLTGEVFDQVGAATPFSFAFGSGSVIPGLELGIAEMEVQERALILMPSFLAYRESAAVIPGYLSQQAANENIIPTYAINIPPYTPLIFEVNLIGAD